MSAEPWYFGGLRFQCTGCGQCCIGDPGYVYVTRREIELLATLLKTSLAEFKARFVRQAGQRKSLRELPGGDCVFFDRITLRCRVYEARPRQCHTWPFWNSNLGSLDAWEQTCRTCAGCGRGPTVPAAEIEAQAASDDL